MSERWAERERDTNRLARLLWSWLLEQSEITSQQLHGLAKLSWITKKEDFTNPSYIRSTKIPALAAIVGVPLPKKNLSQVADRVAEIVDIPGIVDCIVKDTGFVNLRNSYRISSLDWIETCKDAVQTIYQLAYEADSENEHADLITKIAALPTIPTPRGAHNLQPENFLTPVCFMLDPAIRFPIINGDEQIRSLLRQNHATNIDLLAQYRIMVSAYGQGAIRDAADLDQAIRSGSLRKIISGDDTFLESKDVRSDEPLGLKDEADVERIQGALQGRMCRIHNQLTNCIKEKCKRFTLLEGAKVDCRFDVEIRKFKGESNLLVEVKSSADIANVRMAVGQALSYWFLRYPDEEQRYIAVFLPEKPKNEIVDFLQWLNVGLLWLEEDRITTSTNWLKDFCQSL